MTRVQPEIEAVGSGIHKFTIKEVNVQLSLHADYACRVLIFLTAFNSRLSSVDEIADAFKVSQNHLVKVVYRLGKLGFIETVRGRGGGIRLACDPSKISIGDVVRQMEQPGFDIVECFNKQTNSCPIVTICGLKPWLYKATEAFLQVLDEVTLKEIASNEKSMARVLKTLRRIND